MVDFAGFDEAGDGRGCLPMPSCRTEIRMLGL